MTPCKSQLTRSRAAAAAPMSAWFSYLHCCRAVARRQELSSEGDAAERAKRAAGGFLLLFLLYLFVTFTTGTLLAWGEGVCCSIACVHTATGAG